VNSLAIENNLSERLGLRKQLLPTGPTRKLNKQHMLHNDLCPVIEVDPQTFDVSVDGQVAYCEPAETLPLTQRYMLR
jgi:urease subunit alpha